MSATTDISLSQEEMSLVTNNLTPPTSPLEDEPQEAHLSLSSSSSSSGRQVEEEVMSEEENFSSPNSSPVVEQLIDSPSPVKMIQQETLLQGEQQVDDDITFSFAPQKTLTG